MSMNVSCILLLVGGAAVLGACSHTAIARTEESLIPKSTRLLNDRNIVAMTMDSDSSEVALAQSVRGKLSDPRLRDFAQTLIDDHSRSLAQLKALSAATGITPDRPQLDSIPQETEHLMTRFGSMAPGAAFDTAFANHEVRDHHSDIGDVQDMAEWATNDQLKNALNAMFPVLEKHLRIAESLGGKP